MLCSKNASAIIKVEQSHGKVGQQVEKRKEKKRIAPPTGQLTHEIHLSHHYTTRHFILIGSHFLTHFLPPLLPPRPPASGSRCWG